MAKISKPYLSHCSLTASHADITENIMTMVNKTVNPEETKNARLKLILNGVSMLSRAKGLIFWNSRSKCKDCPDLDNSKNKSG